MRQLFADTFYWVALFSPRDRWHKQALAISRTLGEDHLWTTDEVPTEFLAICSAAGPRLRQPAVNLVRHILWVPKTLNTGTSLTSPASAVNLDATVSPRTFLVEHPWKSCQ